MKNYKIMLNGVTKEWPMPTITGAQLRVLFAVDPASQIYKRDRICDCLVRDDATLPLSRSAHDLFTLEPAFGG